MKSRLGGEARQLLDSIDTATIVGLRDRALIGLLVFTFARIGAVLDMCGRRYWQHRRLWVRLHEKGGKHHELPVHHKAEEYLDAYLKAAGIADQKGTPLWRSMTKERGWGDGRMSRQDVFRMVKRRCRQAERGRQLPHLPGHRNYGLSAEWRHSRARAGDRRA